ILREKSYKLCGILNGIDVDSYNPKTDPDIYKHYTARSLSGKAVNKAKVQELLGLEAAPDRPLIVMISRLVGMKGLDLVRYIFDEIMAQGCQFAVLGTGDYIYENFFREQAQRHPGAMAFWQGFV